MPAKPCPSCGLKNPASATRCDCGHSFGGDELALVEQRTCPSCRWVNPATAIDCRCGHSFIEDHEEVRHLLMHQLTTSWFAIVGGMMMIFAGLGLVVLQEMVGAARFWLPTGAIIAGIGVTVKGGRGMTRARAALDTLGARPLGPPMARMLKK